MAQLAYVEFYITNVCNLNCTNCNRYNNFAFSGHDLWKTHEADYEQWARQITFPRIGILGGEPLANPDFINWLSGIARLWPDSQIEIVTNGSLLMKKPGLYEKLLEYAPRVILEVNSHNQSEIQKLHQILDQFLTGPVSKQLIEPVRDWRASYQSVKDESWPACDTPEGFTDLPLHIQTECLDVHGLDPWHWINPDNHPYQSWTDANGITANIRSSWMFYEPAVRFDPETQKLSLQNSDPDKAVAVCNMKACHHFISGKLYKCGAVGILPRFLEQFHLDISQEDLSLLKSYEPAQADWSEEKIKSFVRELREERSIPQCKFCPESVSPIEIFSGTKKIKLQKKSA
jgi:organic radical activating enzyme